MCWAPRPGLAPWKLDPNPTPARLFLAVHPSRMPQSRGLAKPQMFRTLTQCLCVLHRGLMWPQRWSWNCSDLCVVLGFHPCFQGEAGGSTFAQGFLSWSAQPVGTCPVSGASGKGGGGGGSGLCYDYCLSCIRKLPAVSVPRELNRMVRENFMPYIMNYFEFQRVATHTDGSALADLGTYMDGYEE